MTRHRGAQPNLARSSPCCDFFTLASTLDDYEVVELTPKQAAELLVHLRRSGFNLSPLGDEPPRGD